MEKGISIRVMWMLRTLHATLTIVVSEPAKRSEKELEMVMSEDVCRAYSVGTLTYFILFIIFVQIS